MVGVESELRLAFANENLDDVVKVGPVLLSAAAVMMDDMYAYLKRLRACCGSSLSEVRCIFACDAEENAMCAEQ